MRELSPELIRFRITTEAKLPKVPATRMTGGHSIHIHVVTRKASPEGSGFHSIPRTEFSATEPVVVLILFWTKGMPVIFGVDFFSFVFGT